MPVQRQSAQSLRHVTQLHVLHPATVCTVPHRSPPVRQAIAIRVVSLGLIGIAATYLLAPLNGNIRYEAGVKEVGTASAAATFSHRPLGFRILMDGVFRLARAVSSGTSSFEFVVRLLVVTMAVGAAVLLWRGLLEHGVRQPGLHAAIVVGVLVLVGPINAAEPDWMAVVLATAGAGVALLGRRRPWLWALLAGALFVGAAGMKIVTLPTALLGLGVVGLLDRRQLIRALAGSVVIGVLYVIVTLVWVPWEVQWLLDIGSVQSGALGQLPSAVPFFAELAARRPVLALLPAVLVLAGRRERVTMMLAVGLAAGSVVVQGQYFAYHGIPLLVVASVAVFRGLRARMTTATGIGVLTIVLAASALSTTTNVWLADHQKLWAGVTLAVSLIALAWAFAVRTRPTGGGPSGPMLAALATLALLYPGSTPWAAQLVRPENPDGGRPLNRLESRAQDEDTADRVRQVVGGPDVLVTYLTFGEWTYFIGNPTDCRYPSPLFLQRSSRRTLQNVRSPSFEENLACLSAPGSRWLIWDPTWFTLERTPAQVQDAVAREWDCSQPVKVRELRLCPRRTRTS